MYNFQSIKFWMNFIGLALNGAGTFLLAYIVLSSNKWSKEDKDIAKNKHDVSLDALSKSISHEIESSDKNIVLNITYLAYHVRIWESMILQRKDSSSGKESYLSRFL